MNLENKRHGNIGNKNAAKLPHQKKPHRKFLNIRRSDEEDEKLKAWAGEKPLSPYALKVLLFLAEHEISLDDLKNNFKEKLNI